MIRAQWSMRSKIGPLYLVASGKGLQGIFWKKQNAPLVKTKLLAKAIQQLKEYFEGDRRTFTLPMDVTGTPFQKSVWNELRKIPYGRTVAYKAIANQIKNGKAVRAVGNANGRNPLCILIPCHRVIAGDGTLGGYSGGLDKKKKLLRLEQK